MMNQHDQREFVPSATLHFKTTTVKNKGAAYRENTQDKNKTTNYMVQQKKHGTDASKPTTGPTQFAP